MDATVVEVDESLVEDDGEPDDKVMDICRIKRRAWRDTLNVDVWVMRNRVSIYPLNLR
jgi:hypothetical protein